MTITLATLEQATEQEVFDQVSAHMLAQNRKSEIDIYGCLYRGPDGLKCAAGCLIGDDEYQAWMECMPWTRLVSEGFPKSHCALILKLQIVHDEKNTKDWRHELERVAIEFGLEFRA